MQRHFSENVLREMREEIARSGGNEVFFLGRTDENRIVTQAEPLARGNRDAVAAILVSVSFGDVVIHNHPSGNLTPSNPDIEIASVVGNRGVGFLIVDNGLSRCNEVVPPFARKELQQLSYPEIEGFFSPGGTMSRHLEEYEHREEQVRMAFAVAAAFNGNRVAVIEAGTGTGKSLAYLLPAALWSVRNRERVVISTNTINLQEQLTKKDIPFLRSYLGIDFRAVLVKGRSNYLCRRKLEAVKTEPALFPDESESELAAILEWSATTGEGCRSDLSFIPREEVWEEVSSEGDQCSRARCPSYARCFFYGARREAAGADILVVNHALLMSDAAVRAEAGGNAAGILPPFQRLVFDEAHHMEETATGHLSTQASRYALQRILGRLQHPRKAQKGLLPRLSAQLSRDIPDGLDELYIELSSLLETEIVTARADLLKMAEGSLDALALKLLEHLKVREKKGEHKLRVTPELHGSPLWRETEERVGTLARELRRFAALLKTFAGACERLPEEVREKLSGALLDMKGIRTRLEAAAVELSFFVAGDEGYCRWYEVKIGARGMAVRLCAAPLEVSEQLRRSIWESFPTVVATSATLAVGESFSFLKGRTGISLLPAERVTELLLPSPFDYRTQAFVGIPSDLPDPTTHLFARRVQEHLLRAVAVSGGRAFILFTSYDLLRRVYDGIAADLERIGLTPMRQGEINRHLLLERFRKSKNPVLFGTDSFWEGVDVKGRGLELVAITRLPFRVPTEPVLEARAEHLAQKGGDPFMEYTIPQAVIKFKQGFGRLIRSRDDRGGVLILDNRVLTRGYGRFFLDALPHVEPVTGGGEEVYARLAEFFSSFPASPASPRSCTTGGS